MSNVIAFRRHSVPDEFSNYEIDPQLSYTEVWPMYVAEYARLAFLVESDRDESPMYLVLHQGDGTQTRCLMKWDAQDVQRLGTTAIVTHALIAARAIEHVSAINSYPKAGPQPFIRGWRRLFRLRARRCGSKL